MNIQSISALSPSFNAKLYNPKGRLIKNTNFLDFTTDTMSEKGSKATTIFVRSINSKESFGDYVHEADLSIDNPLFGLQSFKKDFGKKTTKPYSEANELNLLEYLTGMYSNDCKSFENEALFQKIMSEIKNRCELFSYDKRIKLEDLSPRKILSDLLNKTTKEEHGFDESRIKDFEAIADRIQLAMYDVVNEENIKQSQFWYV